MITISAIVEFFSKVISFFGNNVLPYLIAILLFIVLIVIHEFGHFIAAKLLGVRVNEFAIGMGPKLLRWGKGETKYSINALPIGGYCAMEGEDEESHDERAFCNKKPWRRFLIVVMGAVFNLILGFILVAITLIPQDRFATTIVGGFRDDIPVVSREHGLEVGDEIIAVDGRKIFAYDDLWYSFSNVDDGAIDITVKRDGKKVQLNDVRFASEEIDGINLLTIDFKVIGEEKNFFTFIEYTFKTTISSCVTVYRSLIDLITGRYGISSVSGVVGVTAAIGEVAKVDILNLIPVMYLITINLGLFNLLPVPALDGGRLVFILFEMIFRKPVPKKFEAIVHAVGMVLLLLLMAVITVKDIWTLIF